MTDGKTAPRSIRITLNGVLRTAAAGSTVADLLRELAIRRDQVAVERNRAIVPRKDHETTALEDGDELELVTFLGGG